jgi:hypothetical protein
VIAGKKRRNSNTKITRQRSANSMRNAGAQKAMIASTLTVKISCKRSQNSRSFIADPSSTGCRATENEKKGFASIYAMQTSHRE